MSLKLWARPMDEKSYHDGCKDTGRVCITGQIMCKGICDFFQLDGFLGHSDGHALYMEGLAAGHEAIEESYPHLAPWANRSHVRSHIRTEVVCVACRLANVDGNLVWMQVQDCCQCEALSGR